MAFKKIYKLDLSSLFHSRIPMSALNARPNIIFQFIWFEFKLVSFQTFRLFLPSKKNPKKFRANNLGLSCWKSSYSAIHFWEKVRKKRKKREKRKKEKRKYFQWNFIWENALGQKKRFRLSIWSLLVLFFRKLFDEKII